MSKQQIFISHSFNDKDKEIYDSIWALLEQRGFKCWDPSTLAAGTVLKEKLLIAIKQCSVCIFIATSNSLESQWCASELGAFWGQGKKIIVYIADETISSDSLPPQFKGDIYTAHKSVLITSVRELLDASDNLPSQQPVQSLKDPDERISYFTRIHDRSRSLFSVSVGFDIDDRRYYTEGQVKSFLSSVIRILQDQHRRYERYQLVTGAPRSWLRFLLKYSDESPHTYIHFLNLPDPTLFRARLMQIFISEDESDNVGFTTYLVSTLETGSAQPYGLQIDHSAFSKAFEGQVASYYSEVYKRYGISSDTLRMQLELSPDQSEQLITNYIASSYSLLESQDEDTAVLTVIRQTNTLDHSLIRQILNEERTKRLRS